MILLGKLRRCHFTLLIIHRIACQFRRGAEDGNDFIQNGSCSNTAVTGVQVEIQIRNDQRSALRRLRLSSAAGRSGIGLFPCISHISNGARRAFRLTVVAMVDTAVRVDDDRDGCFALVENTVRTEIHAGATLHTSQNVNDRIPGFRPFLVSPYTSKCWIALKR